MKFSQYIWGLYKQSTDGQKVINEFRNANREMLEYEFLRKYNPYSSQFYDQDFFLDTCDDLWELAFEGRQPPTNKEDAKHFYEALVVCGIYDGEDTIVKKGDYQFMLRLLEILSFLLYYFSPSYFIPNLFVYRFFDLNKIADAFDIELPPIPKKSDYKARYMYYWDLCKILHEFRIENNLSPEELCAFLYDYAPSIVAIEPTEAPKPSQAWFIGGLISPEEQNLEVTFWQANPETRKGDIIVHYETSPISAITHIWIAQTDGVIDPFFHYYSNAYIGEKVKIPSISLKELRADGHFSRHPLIRKSFQGVNGWAMSSEDYVQLLRILRSKGCDIEQLPKLYSPSLPSDIDVASEKDVEVKLLEYYLHKIGLQENRSYIRQLPIRAGRGNRVYPDYALHYSDKSGYESAKILIEAKYHMKSVRGIEEAFKQARSYANLLESSTIILCDKECLIVYDRKEGFDRSRYKKIYWSELENPNTYNYLKGILLGYEHGKDALL